MKFINAFALSLFLAFGAHAQTNDTSNLWSVDSANSRVNFVSIKKGNIAETHVFNDVSGSINNGNASITIKPDSIDSRVPIRNERMREFLFETGVYPTIEVNAKVNTIMAEIEEGSSVISSVPATLSMHGHSKELNLSLRISKLNADTIVVASTESVLIVAADYEMLEGITKLSSLVNNLAIAETVPVNFSLQLTRN